MNGTARTDLERASRVNRNRRPSRECGSRDLLHSHRKNGAAASLFPFDLSISSVCPPIIQLRPLLLVGCGRTGDDDPWLCRRSLAAYLAGVARHLLRWLDHTFRGAVERSLAALHEICNHTKQNWTFNFIGRFLLFASFFLFRQNKI